MRHRIDLWITCYLATAVLATSIAIVGMLAGWIGQHPARQQVPVVACPLCGCEARLDYFDDRYAEYTCPEGCTVRTNRHGEAIYAWGKRRKNE